MATATGRCLRATHPPALAPGSPRRPTRAAPPAARPPPARRLPRPPSRWRTHSPGSQPQAGAAAPWRHSSC
eukprot:107047-Lingulodinium_polyedra.AAC.1